MRDHWRWQLERSPIFATAVGDRRFDDRMPEVSHTAVLSAMADLRQFARQAQGVDPAGLSPTDAITRALFQESLRAALETESCQRHVWSVSARGNPVSLANALPQQHVIASAADADNLLARYRQIPGLIDDTIANLRRGAAAGMYANAESVRRTIALVDRQLDTPLKPAEGADPAAQAGSRSQGWELLRPVRDLDTSLPEVASDRRAQLARDLEQVVSGDIRAAFARYRTLLADEILPRARTGNRIGVGSLPGGQDCYRALVASFTGKALDPADLHALGLREIERINREMTVLGQRLFTDIAGANPSAEETLAAVISRLRTDPALYFDNQDDILSAANTALAQAKARMGEFFGILPKADCVVRPIPDFSAPYTTIAYYSAPHPDGGKPGEYFINTYKPQVRPRFEMQVLAYHEAIPGHHLQIAIAQERGNLPAFRRYGGNTAFVEGWALYTERLSEEMGLYSGDLDRMGMLSYDAWRAARLVVDTGLHAMGWTRAQAEEYMRIHTALTEDNIANEVDRYISWPGQAVAYKVGQLDILRLRSEAESALGPRFDIRRFHDTVLKNGAVTLAVLEIAVRDWIAEERAP